MSSLIVAKTCGCNVGCNVGERDSSFILESYETFCVDKKNIIVASSRFMWYAFKIYSRWKGKEAIVREIREN